MHSNGCNCYPPATSQKNCVKRKLRIRNLYIELKLEQEERQIEMIYIQNQISDREIMVNYGNKEYNDRILMTYIEIATMIYLRRHLVEQTSERDFLLELWIR